MSQELILSLIADELYIRLLLPGISIKKYQYGTTKTKQHRIELYLQVDFGYDVCEILVISITVKYGIEIIVRKGDELKLTNLAVDIWRSFSHYEFELADPDCINKAYKVTLTLIDKAKANFPDPLWYQ